MTEFRSRASRLPIAADKLCRVWRVPESILAFFEGQPTLKILRLMTLGQHTASLLAKPIHHFLENLYFFNKNARPLTFDRTGNE